MKERYILTVLILAFFAFYFLPYYLPEAGKESPNPVLNGLFMLYDYTSLHVISCLIPAFFIAGAMSALLPKEKITKYLGRNVPKYKAYPLSIIAGLLLAVCSCTILPLFAGIRKKGAGIGPAIAFLYTAPATNILAIIFTGSVLGGNIALARIVLSITFALLTGIIISSVFKDDERIDEEKAAADNSKIIEKTNDATPNGAIGKLITYRLPIFFITLVAILLLGASKVDSSIKVPFLVGLLAVVPVQLKLGFVKEEIEYWLSETYMFFRTIFPLLLAGIFVAGFLSALIPKNALAGYVGGNSVFANLIAVLFGTFMYFPTLVEVPMAKLFLSLGMGKGPLMAYLLADPVLSLPSILVVRKIMGTKKTLLYVFLIVVFCTIAGLIYGTFAG
jgi:uncharacterized membrane protein YraQ (UPF0718 family)